MISSPYRIACLMVGCIAAVLLSQSELAAHPFHISIGEMEWNAKSQRWEVAVRLQAADLQTAVRRFSKSQVVVDGQQAPEELIEYLKENFFLSPKPIEKKSKPDSDADLSPKSADSKSLPVRSDMKWVGQEVERGWLWLYFELSNPKIFEPIYLTNTLLVEVVDEQTNTVLIRLDDKRHSVQTTLRSKTERVDPSVLPQIK